MDSMPEDIYGLIRNANSDPCDVVYGPCACGSWHNLDCWVDRSEREGWPSWVIAQIRARFKDAEDCP